MNNDQNSNEMSDFESKMADTIAPHVTNFLDYLSNRYVKPYIAYVVATKSFSISGFRQSLKDFEEYQKNNKNADKMP